MTGTTDSILVLQEIRKLIEQGRITRPGGVDPGQIQPASLDLTVGRRAWRVRSGFLSERGPVSARLADLALYELDLAKGAILERGHPYIVELAERLDLPGELRARCNPRSSTGRLDIFTRLVADGCARFDELPPRYEGPLFLEVVPRSFSIRLTAGLSLNQIRFYRGDPRLEDLELRALTAAEPLVTDQEGERIPPEKLLIEGGISLRLSLQPNPEVGDIVGYKARRFSEIVGLSRKSGHNPLDFWEPIRAPRGGRLILEPEVFYLLASYERIKVPPRLAAEMIPFDVGLGELRTNYAGFFDNGFGPARAVLEVRAHDVPFLVEHGQPLFRMQFFRTALEPERLYGEAELGSYYQSQGLALSRHFG